MSDNGDARLQVAQECLEAKPDRLGEAWGRALKDDPRSAQGR